MSMLSNAIKSVIKFITNGEVWKEVLVLGEEILKTVLGGVGADLQSAAMEAVTAAEATGGTGEEKFAAAYKDIVATFKNQTFKENVVNHAIENAVLAYNAKTGTVSFVTPLAVTSAPVVETAGPAATGSDAAQATGRTSDDPNAR